ncbi:MAG TPA: ABC transporter permease [Pseudogracilibacillus sp.]|nr:ABC transporter permease [Pseudogracilibacillus sp.]
MNKFFLVLGHTYWSRLKSKAFIITTAILLLLVLAVANIDSIIKLFESDTDTSEVIVVNDSTLIYSGLVDSLKDNDAINLTEYKEGLEEGKKAVKNEDYDALLVIDEDAKSLPEITYYAKSIAGDEVQSILESNLQVIKDSILIEQAGIDEDTLLEMNQPVNIEKLALDESAKTDEELDIARGIVYAMIFILYMAVLIYGQMIATDVATEKSSRVMEILISSASPVTHMFAKIIGIALLGITQAVIVGVGSFLAILPKLEDIKSGLFEELGLESISPTLFLYAILFFLLGYLLYATIAAMFGSLVSRVEDLQQLLMPMIILILIAFFIAMFGLNVPEAKFITVSSFIPFFSPMIMFLRIGMLEVPSWEIALSIGILVGTIIILGLIGARIYRGGVLMYGPSRSLKDIKNAFNLSKKEEN